MGQGFGNQLRDNYLSGNGVFGGFIYPHSEELKKSKFFLDTMETLVLSAEQHEVSTLEAKTQGLTPEQLDEYWQWHYPIHWQEIFSNRLRASFIMQLCSFVEGELNDIACRVGVIAEAPLKLRDLNGSTLSKPRKFIEAFGHLTQPDNNSWALMEQVFDVRNVMVHEGGFAGSYRNYKQLVIFATTVPGLSFNNGHIEVNREFCDYCILLVSSFVESLHQSYESFRATAHTLEKMKLK